MKQLISARMILMVIHAISPIIIPVLRNSVDKSDNKVDDAIVDFFEYISGMKSYDIR